jgi:GDP-4-dehydro-6-deoxy-D-mannose reductase
MKKIFITGITGFAGIHFTEFLLQKNINVTGIYYPENTFKKFNERFPDVKIHLCNILDYENLKKIIISNKPDTIYHLAAISSVKQSFTDINLTIDANLKGFINLLNCVEHLDYNPKIIFISSADIYGNTDNFPIKETHSANPISPYAITKYSAELFFKLFIKSHNIQGIIARPFNHIGPIQNPDFAVSSFSRQIVEFEKKNKPAVIKTGDLSSRRDITDVRDIVRAYYLLDKIKIKNNPEIFNIGSNKSYSIEFLLNTLISLSKNNNIKINQDKKLFRKIDIRKLQCDYTKFNVTTGWEPEYNIKETLNSILNYWRSEI